MSTVIMLNGRPTDDKFDDRQDAGLFLERVADVLMDEHGFEIAERGTPDAPRLVLRGPSGVVLDYRIV